MVAAAEIYTVTTTADAGPGSVRDAISTADSSGLGWTIDFQIGTGSQTISPLSALPSITVPILIDGTSQPGYSGTPLIFLRWRQGRPRARADDHRQWRTIKGLIVSRFARAGILLSGNDNLIQNDYVGTDPTGTLAQGNGAGIEISSSGNTIRGNRSGGS